MLRLVRAGREVEVGRSLMLEKEYTVSAGQRDSGFKIKVVRRYRQALGQMTEQDAVKEGFTSLAEFQEAWTQIP